MLAWPTSAPCLLLELWRGFPDGKGVVELFAESATVELPLPLVRGVPRRINGRKRIAEVLAMLSALAPSFKFRGQLRLVTSSADEAVAEYRRHPSEVPAASERRFFVRVQAREGQITSVRVVLERAVRLRGYAVS